MLHSVVQMLDASALYILAGFLLAGVLHVLLDRRKNLLDPLRGKGPRPVILGTLIGIPLPLCSCSVLPTAMSLLRSGASKGATASFLITVPETDVVSIMLTYGLLGPVMAVARPIASLFTGIVSGLAVDAATRDEKPAPAPLMMAEEETGGCCCSEPAAEKKPNPVREALQFGFVKFFDDIILILVLGLAISAVIAGVFPRVDTSLLTDNHFLSYALMLAVGIPMYICATASTPIAASLVLAGVSPGAALVLLLAGPATNTAGLVLMRREFGTRVFTIYLLSIIVMSLLMGVGLDLLLAHTTLPAPVAAIGDHIHVEDGRRWGTWLFAALTLTAVYRRIRKGKTKGD
jgi:uncharacterized protein